MKMKFTNTDEIQLRWLDLERGHPTEVTIITNPVYAKVHAYLMTRGTHRNFGCRQPDPCFWCAQGNKATAFAFLVVRCGGELWLYQATRSLLRRVDLEAGMNLVLERLDRNPWMRVLGVSRDPNHQTKVDQLAEFGYTYEELSAVPERIAAGLRSVGYLVDNGPAEVLDFLNRKSRN